MESSIERQGEGGRNLLINYLLVISKYLGKYEFFFSGFSNVQSYFILNWRKKLSLFSKNLNKSFNLHVLLM